MKLKRIGVDLAKQVFQVHGVDSHEQLANREESIYYVEWVGAVATLGDAAGSR